MLLSGNPVDVNSLVINADNQSLFTNPAGGIVVTNATLGTKDGLVIEGISISPTSGDSISISLTGIPLKRLAIESLNITQNSAAGSGINLDLVNVTGLDSVAIEDLIITGNGRGIDLNFVNTDAGSLSIEDSQVTGIIVSASQDQISVTALFPTTELPRPLVSRVSCWICKAQATARSSANDFRIINNSQISTRDRDAVRIAATGAPE
ncbi:MAG UNVERIFIED_CONTAM: hypothetical protein LVR18_38355 [Planctomycetaceae bacterium]|jgi:hypothetical protein